MAEEVTEIIQAKPFSLKFFDVFFPPFLQKDRGQWGSQMEFMMTMISYAVGIGNIWRFPYLTYSNGGGAFLIPYATMLAIVGMPMFFMETALGQYCGLGPSKAWKISPLFRGLGWASWSVTFMISMYYNVLVSYMLYYLIASMASRLPWETCAQGNGTWASKYCIDSTAISSLNGSTGSVSGALNNATCINGTLMKYRTPSEDYYYNYVLNISDGINDGGSIQWRLAISLFVAWLICACVLIKGVQSLGKIVYVTALFPYIMLTIVLINNLLQPGALDGIIFYIKPDFSKLLNYEIWADAAGQIFFSLSISWGGLIAMSSFSTFSNNVHRDTIFVCLLNCGTSVYGGFAIFSTLGTLALAKGTNVSQVATTGPELALVTYPAALALMEVAPLWSILFYVMMALLGFGSQFSNLETVMTIIFDEVPWLNRNQVRSIAFRLTVFLFCFFLGLPMITQSGLYLLTLINDNAGNIPLLLIGMLECIAIAWVYGVQRFSDDIEVMIGFRPNIYWRIMWTYITPVVLGALTLIKIYSTIANPTLYAGYIYGANCPYVFPTWAYGLAWCTIITPIIFLLIGFSYQIYIKWNKTDGGFLEVLRIASRPSKGYISQEERRLRKAAAAGEEVNESQSSSSSLELKKVSTVSEKDATSKSKLSNRKLSAAAGKIGAQNPTFKPDEKY